MEVSSMYFHNYGGLMPTYDYMCNSCGTAFEVQHKMTDTPVIVCPPCGASTHQVFSADFGLNFTGKGFYQTDTQKMATPTNNEKSATQTASPQKADKSVHSCNGQCSCQGNCSCSS